MKAAARDPGMLEHMRDKAKPCVGYFKQVLGEKCQDLHRSESL